MEVLETKEKLNKERIELDKIDLQIIRLLADRTKVITKVAEIKLENRIGLFDPNRELEQMQRLKVIANTKNLTNTESISIEKSFKEIIENSKRQQTVVISILSGASDNDRK